MRPRFLAAVLCTILACSREEKRPERTEPWPAPRAVPSGSARPAASKASYELETSAITFELPAKRATPRGRVSSASGRFEIDFDNPDRTSGSVRVDLGLVELEGGEPGGADDRTRRALEWLELGSEVPAAERETRRFATFLFRALEDGDAKRLLSTKGRQKVDGTAVGELSLHGVRAPVRVPVSVEAESAETPGGLPKRLVIRSRRPLVVSLGVHDIRPRNARGVLVARELSLLGDSVGREAKVSFELALVHRP